MELSVLRPRSRSKLLGCLSTFLRDQRGTVAIYVTALLPVLIGGAVLTIDLGRLSNLHTSLQHGADALALAGAAELDRKPSSITRATAAVANLVSNKDKFTGGAAATVAVTSRFLKSLPLNDKDAILSVNETSDPLQTRFIEVVVVPRTFNTYFPVSLFGGTNTKQVSARAVAGFNAAICKSVPMFICNPYEGESTNLFDAIADPAFRRRQIKLQLGGGGNSAQMFPGNYGWLDSPTIGNGAAALRDALGAVRTQACFIQNGVSQRTGNIENANDAINVRFDLWDGPMGSRKTNPDYRPAQNVRKGYKLGNGANGACSPQAVAPNNYRLGKDPSFPYAGGRLGNGNWDFELYWNSNYGAGTAKPAGLTGASNANRPSRYDVYRAEIGTIGSGGATDLVAMQSPMTDGGVNVPVPRRERGTPQCYSGGGLSDVPDRRIIYAAILNCSALSIHGNQGGPWPVMAFGKFFLTQSISSPPDPDAGTIFSELIGLAEPGSVSNDVARDIVQLYR